MKVKSLLEQFKKIRGGICKLKLKILGNFFLQKMDILYGKCKNLFILKTSSETFIFFFIQLSWHKGWCSIYSQADNEGKGLRPPVYMVNYFGLGLIYRHDIMFIFYNYKFILQRIADTD